MVKLSSKERLRKPAARMRQKQAETLLVESGVIPTSRTLSVRVWPGKMGRTKWKGWQKSIRVIRSAALHRECGLARVLAALKECRLDCSASAQPVQMVA